MLGRADPLEVQLAGVIANEELTDAQLVEMLVLMLFYAANTTALNRAISAAKARAREPTEDR